MFLYPKTFLSWVLALIVGSGSGFLRFDHKDFLNSYVVDRLDIRDVRLMNIHQPLDHFNSFDPRKWSMRYLENLEWFVRGGPIILFIGGASIMDSLWTKYGLAANFAKEVGGALFVSEHRFYGGSVPNNDVSVENLVYLSSEQALADIINLLKFIKSETRFFNSKVVVFGGSYAGNLAAWLKLLYPDKIDAAWVSSGLVLAEADFYQYLEVVAESLKKFGTSDCYEKVVKKFQRYGELMKTAKGIEQLVKEENICKNLDMEVVENQQLFFMSQIVVYSAMVQYGTPDIIRKKCSKGFSSENLFGMSGFHIWNQEENCLDSDFNHMIQGFANTPNYKSWIYQTCTEFGYMKSTSSANQPFTQHVPIEFFYKMCTELFGPEFGEESIKKGVLRTNTKYGGLKPNVRNVVFTNGDIDPWHRLGVLKDFSSEVPSRVIANASHCSDLSDNLLEGADIRAFAKRKVRDWIGL